MLNVRVFVAGGEAGELAVGSVEEDELAGGVERSELGCAGRDEPATPGAGSEDAEEGAVLVVVVDREADWAAPSTGVERAAVGSTCSEVCEIAELTANQARAMAARVAPSQVNGTNRRRRFTPAA